jgi:hypothetical protein
MTEAKYLAHVVEVMRENRAFIRNNAEGVYEEVIELINDAIDEVGFAVEKPEREKDCLERSMTFFIYHVLMPFSYAIYWDLLAGNVSQFRSLLTISKEKYRQEYGPGAD